MSARKSRGTKKSRPANKDIDDLLVAFMESATVDRTAAYVARGRRLAGESTEGLKAAWISTLRQLATNPIEPRWRADWEDQASELALRNERLPFEDAKAEHQAWLAATRRLLDEKEQLDPNDWERMAREIERDLQRFADETSRSN